MYVVYNDREPPPSVPKGRPRYNEQYLVDRYVQERINGLHRSHLAGAKSLLKYANKHSGGDETKKNRLRRKFSAAWKAYLEQNKSTNRTS